MYDTRRHNIHDVYTTDTGLCVYVAHTVFIPNFESFSVGDHSFRPQIGVFFYTDSLFFF